jgi:C4-dicarboxylate-specific signal transduction histidine kinase
MLLASPVNDGQGRVTNYFLSYLDITRQHDAEEQVRALTSGLEEHVEARTHELQTTNAKLQATHARLKLIADGALRGGDRG